VIDIDIDIDFNIKNDRPRNNVREVSKKIVPFSRVFTLTGGGSAGIQFTLSFKIEWSSII